jgi:molybdopterin-guanine dinucleotide biosynthesis protein A
VADVNGGEWGTGNGEQFLGAILAGGASRRFGAPKALAEVGGRRIVERVRDALMEAGAEVVVIANDASLFADLRLEMRADEVAGMGPLAGIVAAVRWAAERGHAGALCVACDMPFLPAALLRRLAEGMRPTIVVPESRGRRGVEPLCAWYPVECLAAAERMIAEGSWALRPLLERFPTERVPLAEVERIGDPEVLFLNVNTPADHELAQRITADVPA